MNLKEKVIHSIKWLVIAQISSQVIRTIVTILVIRDFDAREMTYVALSSSIFGFFELFSTFGLSHALISKKEVLKEDMQNAFGMMLMVNCLLLIIVFGGAEFFSQFYNTPELANILKLTSLTFLLSAVGYVPGALLAKEMRFKLISIIQLISGLSGALTSFLCSKIGLGYWSMVWGGIAIPLVSTVLKISFSPVIHWPKLSLKEAGKNLRFGGLMVGQGIAWYAFVTMDIVIAGKFWSAEILGVYALAVQVVSMPLNRTLPLIRSVALPAYSRSMIEDRSMLESHSVKGLKLSLVLAVPMFWGAAATSAVLVPVFLGENWLSVIIPMALLSIGAPFRFLVELMAPAVLVTGNTMILFRNEVVISLCMQVFFCIVIFNSESPALLAGVWALVYPVLVLRTTHRYCRFLKIRFKVIMQAILPVAASGLVMMAIVLLVTYSLLGTLSYELLLPLAVATGVLVYGCVLFLMDRDVFSELISMARGARK